MKREIERHWSEIRVGGGKWKSQGERGKYGRNVFGCEGRKKLGQEKKEALVEKKKGKH